MVCLSELQLFTKICLQLKGAPITSVFGKYANICVLGKYSKFQAKMTSMALALLLYLASTPIIVYLASIAVLPDHAHSPEICSENDAISDSFFFFKSATIHCINFLFLM